MSFFDGIISVNNVTTLLFVVFAVLMAGYALGRITIKGVSLGDAGVFIIALLFQPFIKSNVSYKFDNSNVWNKKNKIY